MVARWGTGTACRVYIALHVPPSQKGLLLGVILTPFTTSSYSALVVLPPAVQERRWLNHGVEEVDGLVEEPHDPQVGLSQSVAGLGLSGPLSWLQAAW